MTQDRRRFSKREKTALFLAADGKSELSGEPLGDHWHADHIVPWSLGGKTTMDNAQPLTSDENIRKGARSDIESALTRSWQIEFLKKYKSFDQPDFLLAALPAAGKTRAALGVAAYFLKQEPDRRLIIVGPTLNIRTQWKTEAQKIFGIQLLTERFAANLNDQDFQGVVTTYHTVASNALVFKRLCIKHKCMVIFDEIHHAGDHASWGRALREAFEPATQRLSLSGTPFRSDGEPIPFLNVGADGIYRIDFGYDYPAALRDGVIREISFHRYAGSVTFKRDDKMAQTFHTDDELDEDDAARRLSLLLSSPGYMSGLLQAAHDQLIEVRKTKPDAGGLVLCQTADHAVWVQDLLRQIVGDEPDLIVSDGELATSTVESFRKNSRRMWAVAVRQVSEGVDIRRLMVLAYATNWRTSLFFRQAVGRIMRYEGTDMDLEAYCFLPQDPTLADHARTIEEFQAQIVAERERDESEPRERAQSDPQQLIILDAGVEFGGLTNRGQHHDAEHSTVIIEFARKHQISEAKAAAILHDLGITETPQHQTTPDNEAELVTLARRCSKRANQLAKARNCEPKEVHRQWIKLTNSGHDKMTLVQFRQKLAWLETQMKEIGWI